MSRLTGWLYTLRSLLRRNEADREMADEIAFHIDRQTRRHESHGISPEMARQRRHELGVRIALGARCRHVLSLVMGSGLRTAIAGTAAGSVVSIAIAPFLQPLLFDNRARDPWLLAMVAGGLLVVAAAASLWPSWRATRVEPLVALRAE